MNRIISTFTPMSNKYIGTFTYGIDATISLIVKRCFTFKSGILKLYFLYIQLCCYLVRYRC